MQKYRRFLKTFQGWGPRIEDVTVKYTLWKRRKQCSKKLFYQKESQSLEGGKDSLTDFWDGRRNNIWDGCCLMLYHVLGGSVWGDQY